MNNFRFLPWGVLLVTVTACTGKPVRVESDFGNSVHNMTEAQMYDPEAARNPSAELPGGLDGAKGDAVIDAYRAPPKAGASKKSGTF